LKIIPFFTFTLWPSLSEPQPQRVEQVAVAQTDHEGVDRPSKGDHYPVVNDALQFFLT